MLKLRRVPTTPPQDSGGSRARARDHARGGERLCDGDPVCLGCAGGLEGGTGPIPALSRPREPLKPQEQERLPVGALLTEP